MVYKLRLWVSSWRQFRAVKKKKKKKIDASSLLSIFVVDDPSRQDVTIIIKRSTAP